MATLPAARLLRASVGGHGYASLNQLGRVFQLHTMSCCYKTCDTDVVVHSDGYHGATLLRLVMLVTIRD